MAISPFPIAALNGLSFSIQQKNLVDGYGIKEGLIVAFVVGLVVSFVYAIYVVAIKKEIQV